MQKVLISIPNHLAVRMRAAIPPRKRSQTIARLIEDEVIRREKNLYDCAVAVEKDEVLRREMKDWEVAQNDGLDDESW